MLRLSEVETISTTNCWPPSLQNPSIKKLVRTCLPSEEESQETRLPREFLPLITTTSNNSATNGSTMLSHPSLTGDQLSKFPWSVPTSTSRSTPCPLLPTLITPFSTEPTYKSIIFKQKHYPYTPLIL